MSAPTRAPACASANLDAMSHATAYQKAIQRLVAAHLPLAGAPPGKDYFIDFGAGKGEYAQALKNQTGAEIVCVEPEISLHAHYAPDLPRSADLWQLSCGEAARGEPLPAAGAYSLNVFEHVNPDVTALNELVSCIRPGGLVFILVPADPLLWTAMDAAVGHVRRYTPTRLRALAILAGLKVEAEGWFDRTGYLATRAQKTWTNRARAPEWDGRISAWQVRLFDWAFRILEPGLARLNLDFGKNRWVLARVPEDWKT